MKKHLLALGAVILFFFLITAPAQSEGITILLNGQKLVCDVSPLFEQGRVLVPTRAIFEALDCKVDWHDEVFGIDEHRYYIIATRIKQKDDKLSGVEIYLAPGETIAATTFCDDWDTYWLASWNKRLGFDIITEESKSFRGVPWCLCVL